VVARAAGGVAHEEALLQVGLHTVGQAVAHELPHAEEGLAEVVLLRGHEGRRDRHSNLRKHLLHYALDLLRPAPGQSALDAALIAEDDDLEALRVVLLRARAG